MYGIGAPELLVILLILLLLFGGKKLPELSRSIGDALRELRRGINGDKKSDKDNPTETQKTE